MSGDKQVTQLAPNRFEMSINGIRHNVHRARPELGTPIDAITDQAYWAHVSSKMRVGDLIEVVPEDASYFAELFVRDVGKLYAKVSVLRHLELNKRDAEVQTPAGYEVRWRGPQAKYGVVRGKDVLKDGFVDKAEATQWITDNLVKAA